MKPLCREDKLVTTGRRIRALWIDEWKRSKGRRESEKRWRETGDIMVEEDMMETSTMYLCIPAQESKKTDRVIVPSDSSYNSLSIVLNEQSNRDRTYHFPVYDINDQPSTVVIIRNLPYYFYLKSSDGYKLISTIQSICPVVSVVRVRLRSPEDANRVQKGINGRPFSARYLRVSVGTKELKTPLGAILKSFFRLLFS